jgi:integrase
VGRYLEDWLELVGPRVRPSTLARYRGLIRLQVIPHLGRIRLSRLAPSDVDRMLARLQEQGLSPQTAAHARAVLRSSLADAEREGLVTRNAAKLARPPRIPYQPPRILTPSEAQAVIEAMPEPGLRRLVTVAIHTGCRQGEVLGARWSGVDLAGRELHVTQALQRIAGEYRLVEVKSRTSRRTIPLTDAAVEALSQERQAQLEARLAAGSRWREAIPGLIFTTGTGQPRSGNSVTHAFGDALMAAGLPPMRWHHLRHAFAGLMLGSGADLATVSHLLGHSSVFLAARTYAGVMPSLKRDAANRFGKLLGG